jgi:hypothetical protein
MPEKLPDNILESADRAIANAVRVREFHRRRTEKDSPQRKTDIVVARQRLKEAMAPIKSAIGKFPYGPQTDTAEKNRQAIRDRSLAIQSERRKLWKMLDPKDR